MDFKVGDKVSFCEMKCCEIKMDEGVITGISEQGNLMIRFSDSGYSRWCHPKNCLKVNRPTEKLNICDDMHPEIYKRMKNLEVRLRELEEWTLAEEERVHKKFDLLQKDIINNAIRYEQSRYAGR